MTRMRGLRMKDGRTHLAHKAEHAVDLETGAVVGVTVQGADIGDTASLLETLVAADEQVEAAVPEGPGIEEEEVVADKGYHSNKTLVDLRAVGLRSYLSEPDRGRRCWQGRLTARDAVYANRRRIRGVRGRRLLRCRGEFLERPFAHALGKLAACGGLTFVGIRTSSSGFSCTSPAATSGCSSGTCPALARRGAFRAGLRPCFALCSGDCTTCGTVWDVSRRSSCRFRRTWPVHGATRAAAHPCERGDFRHGLLDEERDARNDLPRGSGVHGYTNTTARCLGVRNVSVDVTISVSG